MQSIGKDQVSLALCSVESFGVDCCNDESIPWPGTALDSQGIENNNRDRSIIKCFHNKPSMVQ